MDAYETRTIPGYDLEVVGYEWFEDPLDDREGTGRLSKVCAWEYHWEDDGLYPKADMTRYVNNWQEELARFEREAKRQGVEPALVIPLWKYRHSCIVVRAADSNPFHCPWDSGFAGFVWASKEDIRKHWGWKRLTEGRLAFAKKVMADEIKEWSQYLNGEGFEVRYAPTDEYGMPGYWEYYGKVFFDETWEEALDQVEKWLLTKEAV